MLELFIVHRLRLVDCAERILGCRARAEDVVQDGWLRLREATLPRDLRQPASYLFRLVRNLAVDRARRFALEARYGTTEEPPHWVPSAKPSPEEILIAQDMERRLARSLAELPPRTRLVFEMSRMDEAPVEEVARKLDVSASFAYRLLRQATRHCSKRLRDGAVKRTVACTASH
jgi:RNA polymerase sigma-70 factor (ECF subfamily)